MSDVKDMDLDDMANPISSYINSLIALSDNRLSRIQETHNLIQNSKNGAFSNLR